jgi:rod shape-determining protein MreC
VTTTPPNTSLGKKRLTVRRAVIAGLVIVCLGVFTIYFRESASGPLHGLQDAVGSAVSPVESVTARAVRPFQDAWDWTTGLVDARDRAAQLQRDVDRLRAALATNTYDAEQLARLRGITGILSDDLPAGYRPVTASVIAKSPSNWYSRATIDAGTADGVIRYSPVLASWAQGKPGALAGIVTSASRHRSVVTFVTDPSTVVGATVTGAKNPPGILHASTSGQLSLERIPREFKVERNAFVVTAGFSQNTLPSPYPPGLLIGQVAGVGKQEVDSFYSIQVSPLVEVRSLAEVVVLAPKSAAALRRARGG